MKHPKEPSTRPALKLFLHAPMAVKDDGERTGRKMKRDGGRGFGRRGRRGGGVEAAGNVRDDDALPPPLPSVGDRESND